MKGACGGNNEDKDEMSVLVYDDNKALIASSAVAFETQKNE